MTEEEDEIEAAPKYIMAQLVATNPCHVGPRYKQYQYVV